MPLEIVDRINIINVFDLGLTGTVVCGVSCMTAQ